MKTVTIQIGNSDDKLTQLEWSDYLEELNNILRLTTWQIHFSGLSNGYAPWQNACWVFDIKEEKIDGLQIELFSLNKKYRQESTAWTEGITKFI